MLAVLFGQRKETKVLRSCRFTLLACLVGLAACTTLSSADRVVRDVDYVGLYNDINGTLSDGTAFTGKAWFKRSARVGDFCLQMSDAVCSGRYAASPARRVSGDFVCSNGVTGSYETDRTRRGSFVVPVEATGSLSDGRTARATFSEVKEGRGTAQCFVPPA